MQPSKFATYTYKLQTQKKFTQLRSYKNTHTVNAYSKTSLYQTRLTRNAG